MLKCCCVISKFNSCAGNTVALVVENNRLHRPKSTSHARTCTENDSDLLRYESQTYAKDGSKYLYSPNTKISLGFLFKTFTPSPILMLTFGCLLNIDPFLAPDLTGDTLPLFVLPPQPIFSHHIERCVVFSRVSVNQNTRCSLFLN